MAITDIKPDQEPSIEEILESIRQIISEDGQPGEKQAAPAKPAPAPVPSPSQAVPLSLTPDQVAPPSASSLDLSAAPETKPAATGKSLDLSAVPEAKPAAMEKPLDLSQAPLPKSAMFADLGILDLTEKVNPAKAVPPQPRPAMNIEMMDKPKVDHKPMTADKPPQTDALISAQAADAATESLSKLLAGNIAVEKEDVARVGKITLEEITRDLMKPMIKTWLDQNLPGIVEKIVQKEVEKLSRRTTDR